jgi:hypothetical protein
VDGIQLVGNAGDIEVLNVAWVAGPAFSFTFRSVQGANYTISRSTDLLNWTTVTSIPATGTATTFTSGIISPADGRFFFRAARQ